MKQELEKLAQMLKGKSISVVGIGVSNSPLVRLLANMGFKVIARDKNPLHVLGDIYTEFKKYGVEFRLGEDYLDDLKEDIIIKTPGIRYDLPEFLNAKKQGSIITSEMELFFELCPAEIIGVSGSDGKTTTTTLIYNILKEQGYECYLGGNIGKPLLDKIGDIKKDDKIILELSSFQLHTMRQSPHIAVITNIEPNHLDIHKSYNEYIQAKANIFKNQNESDIFITNYDNKVTRELSKNSKGKVIYFSRKETVPGGIYLKNDTIIFDDNGNKFPVLNISDIKLPGAHNIENYMAAIAAIWNMVDIEVINHVAKTFGGVEHRIEFVREVNNVKYYNDSIASSPSRTRAGIYSFDQKVILIAGGYDKKIPFDDLGKDIVAKVKHLILIGETAKSIQKSVENAEGYQQSGIKITRCETMKGAVSKAKEVAVAGDIVLLSPACASFDMFKDFQERGNLFKQLVMEL